MPASKKRSYARYTLAAVELLAALIQLERKARSMTLVEMADRLGVDRETVARLEQGDPTLGVGLAFDACTLLGVRLFDEDDARGLASRLDEAGERLALLPRRVRRPAVNIGDDF